MQISLSHSDLEELGGSISILAFFWVHYFCQFCFIHTRTSVMLLVPIEKTNFPVVLQQITPALLTMGPVLLQMAMVEA